MNQVSKIILAITIIKNQAHEFYLVPHHIDEKNPAFKFCIKDILRRIKNMGPVVDSNEAMRCEYISMILHTAVTIFEGLVILPQMEVSGDDSSGCVDYAIKRIIDNLLEEIICITEGKQNLPGIGIAQNLIQCKSSCEVSNSFMSSLYSSILTNHLQSKT